MVWENNSDIIVMATNFTERGIVSGPSFQVWINSLSLSQDKCARYWPAQGSEGYGQLEVTLLHQTSTDCYNESTLSLRSTSGGEV